MKNILKIKENLMLELNIGNIMENYAPSTVSGTSMKDAMTNAVNEGKISGMTGYLNVLNIFNGMKNVDSGAMKTYDIMESRIAENSFHSKLVFCFEEVSKDESDRANVKNVTLEKLDALSEKEVNEAKNMIVSGFLNGSKSMYPCLELLINESKIEKEKTVITSEHKVYSPVTYNVFENGNLYISFGRRVFGISPEHGVAEVKSPNPKFQYISQVMEHLDYDYKDQSFSYNDPILGEVKITSEGFERSMMINESLETKVNSQAEFISESAVVLEAKCKNRNDLQTRRSMIDGFCAIHENMKDVVVADNVLVVEKASEKFALFNMGNIGKYYVTIVESHYVPNITECFNNANDALNFLEKRSGYDASSFLALEITNESKEDKEKAETIEEQKGIINDLTENLNSIIDLIKEAKEEGNDEKVTKLQDAKDLNEAMIIEQKGKLVEMVK